MLPRFQNLAQAFFIDQQSRVGDTDIDKLATEHLDEMKKLCAAHSARLVVWMPPTPGPDFNAKAILNAGKSRNVPVLVPVANGATPLNEYLDGYHLAPSGAQTNTIALARALRGLLSMPDRVGIGQPRVK